VRDPAALAPTLRQVIDLHRRQLFGVIEVRGVGRLRGLYGQAQSELQSRLAKLVRQGRGTTFSAHHLRLVLAQVQRGVGDFQDKLGGHLDQTGEVAARVGSRQVLDAAEKLHGGFGSPTPLVSPEQAGVFQGIHQEVMPSLLDRFEASKRLYGAPVIAKVRDELSMALLQKDDVDQAVDRVVGTDGVFAGQRWRAERIVRTEMSYAFGVAKQKSMETLKERFVPRLMKRLVATHDDRTGEDSLQLDGQTVDVDKPFVWHVKNSRGVVQRTVLYMQPPNRPNDREVVIPWEAGWPNPGAAGPVEPSGELPEG
jgi:hypothetical protein